MWYDLTAYFNIGPYFLRGKSSDSIVTCFLTFDRYADVLQSFIVPQLQQRGCLDLIISMQDGAPPHKGLKAQSMARQHFSESRIISRVF